MPLYQRFGVVLYLIWIEAFLIFFSFNALFPFHATADPRGISVKARTRAGETRDIKLYSGYHALVVGCGDYRAGWPKLPNPVKDAKEVASTLKKLGFEVKLLEDPDWATLRRSLHQVIAGPGRDRDKAILFWYSGHGHTLKEAGGRDLGYIVPVDAPNPDNDEIGFMGRAISMREIETLARRIRSRHTLMLFDSCFSGAIFQAVRAKPSRYIKEKVQKPVRQFITAGNEKEQVPDQSVFKTVFVQSIQDGYADRNRDGYVTGMELGDYLQEQVVNYSRGAQHPQFGKINDPKLDKGDFVFLTASSGTIIEEPSTYESDYLNPKAQDPGNLKLTTHDIDSRFIDNANIGELFVITGKVKNEYQENRGMVTIVGKIYSSEKVLVHEETIYCGNFMSDLELSNLEWDMIQARLANRLGDNRSNVKVEPGKSIPFMVVFSGLPDDLEEFTIEVTGSTASLETSLIEKGPKTGRLYVNTTPSDARVRILNIGPKFYQGMELAPGDYHVEVSAGGYGKQTRWVNLFAGEDKRIDFRLAGAETAVRPAPVVAPLTTTTGKSRINNSIGMEFVYIKPGSFMMGSLTSESGRGSDERQHEVTLTQGYYLQTTEVTVGQWRKFVSVTGHKSEAETSGGVLVCNGSKCEMKEDAYWDNPGYLQDDRSPVTCVSWNDAQAFIKWLSREEGQSYRLPTEAEWEYAARAGTQTPFYFGDCLSTDQANYNGNYPMPGCDKGQYRKKPVAVGSFPANAWGLHDMHGNVWEWCQDWKGDYPTGSVTDPEGPSSGEFRVDRGGGWDYGAGNCRSADRFGDAPDSRDNVIGFRLARTQ